MTNGQFGIVSCGAICVLLVLCLFVSHSCNSEDVASSSKTSETESNESVQNINEVTDSGSDVVDSIERDILASLHEILGPESFSFAGVTVRGLDDDFEVNFNSEKMECASIIKMFIATCVYQNLDDIVNDSIDKEEVDLTVYKMIKDSDNYAADYLIELLGDGDFYTGYSVVNQMCKDYGFDDTYLAHSFIDNTYYDLNYTSAYDCANLLYMVYNNEIAGSTEIYNSMKDQTRRTKIPAGITDGSSVANKTGEYDGVEQNCAIIEGKHKYILCITCVNDSNYEAVQAIIDIAESVNEIIQNAD